MYIVNRKASKIVLIAVMIVFLIVGVVLFVLVFGLRTMIKN